MQVAFTAGGLIPVTTATTHHTSCQYPKQEQEYGVFSSGFADSLVGAASCYSVRPAARSTLQSL